MKTKKTRIEVMQYQAGADCDDDGPVRIGVVDRAVRTMMTWAAPLEGIGPLTAIMIRYVQLGQDRFPVVGNGQILLPSSYRLPTEVRAQIKMCLDLVRPEQVAAEIAAIVASDQVAEAFFSAAEAFITKKKGTKP